MPTLDCDVVLTTVEEVAEDAVVVVVSVPVVLVAVVVVVVVFSVPQTNQWLSCGMLSF
ncbi:hypothetical protein ACWEKJ_35695 [Amycolatopsis thermoflava]